MPLKIPPRTISHACTLTGQTFAVDIYEPRDLVAFLHESPEGEAFERFVVNIGAGDGVAGDPCYPLYQAGFAGLAIEGADNKALLTNLPQDNVKKVIGTFCTPTNIVEILRAGETPDAFSFLKIDIDGYDGPVLQSILSAGIRPAIIQAEINQEIPFPFEFSVMYSSDYLPVYADDFANVLSGFFGMSFAYAARLAAAYGYHFISSSMQYLTDVILVRNDLAGLFGGNPAMDYDRLDEIYRNHPHKPPHYSHFGLTGRNASFSWRQRSDYQIVAHDIYLTLLQNCLAKHDGKALPFYFGIHPEAGSAHP